MIIARLIGHTQFTLRQLVEILSATYLFFFLSTRIGPETRQ